MVFLSFSFFAVFAFFLPLTKNLDKESIGYCLSSTTQKKQKVVQNILHTFFIIFRKTF